MDSLGIGVGAWNARTFTMNNCVVRGSAAAGVHVSAGSYFLGSNLTIANSGSPGLRVQRSSIGICTGCTLNDNGWAAASASGGLLSLAGSVVTGLNGLQASDNSYADLDCVNVDPGHECRMSVTRRSAWAGDASEVYLLGVDGLEGAFLAYDRSAVYLDTTRQVKTGVGANGQPIPNDIGENSGIFVYNGQLFGDTFISSFARAVLDHPATLDGSMTCQQAGDAWVDSGVVVTPGGSIVGCAHVGG